MKPQSRVRGSFFDVVAPKRVCQPALDPLSDKLNWVPCLDNFVAVQYALQVDLAALVWSFQGF